MSETLKTGLFSKIKSSLWGQALYSVLAGLFGSLLLVVFLTGVMPLAETVRYLPWILGFNASVSGYTLLDRSRDRLAYPKMSGIGIGALVAILAGNLLNALAAKMTGIGLMEGIEMLSFTLIASVFGGLGAWLALKYAGLKEQLKQ